MVYDLEGVSPQDLVNFYREYREEVKYWKCRICNRERVTRKHFREQHPELLKDFANGELMEQKGGEK